MDDLTDWANLEIEEHTWASAQKVSRWYKVNKGTNWIYYTLLTATKQGDCIMTSNPKTSYLSWDSYHNWPYIIEVFDEKCPFKKKTPPKGEYKINEVRNWFHHGRNGRKGTICKAHCTLATIKTLFSKPEWGIQPVTLALFKSFSSVHDWPKPQCQWK